MLTSKVVLIGEDRAASNTLAGDVRGGFFSAGRIACSAIVPSTLRLDIRGKVLGVPVYDLLGRTVRQKLFAILTLRNPATTRGTARRSWKMDGICALGVTKQGDVLDIVRVRENISSAKRSGRRGEEIELLLTFIPG